MGLKEKRVKAEFEENNYPALKSSIEAAAKFAPEIEIDWNSLNSNISESGDIIDFLINKNFKQRVIEPTHESGNILD